MLTKLFYSVTFPTTGRTLACGLHPVWVTPA
jgi:hypothetical protein